MRRFWNEENGVVDVVDVVVGIFDAIYVADVVDAADVVDVVGIFDVVNVVGVLDVVADVITLTISIT